MTGSPRCRYCGADCSDGRSWDGGDLYACPSCADARAAVNRNPVARARWQEQLAAWRADPSSSPIGFEPNPQDFLEDLDVPIYDVVEKGKDQSGIEHRPSRGKWYTLPQSVLERLRAGGPRPKTDLVAKAMVDATREALEERGREVKRDASPPSEWTDARNRWARSPGGPPGAPIPVMPHEGPANVVGPSPVIDWSKLAADLGAANRGDEEALARVRALLPHTPTIPWPTVDNPSPPSDYAMLQAESELLEGGPAIPPRTYFLPPGPYWNADVDPDSTMTNERLAAMRAADDARRYPRQGPHLRALHATEVLRNALDEMTLVDATGATYSLRRQFDRWLAMVPQSVHYHWLAQERKMRP